MPHDLVIVANRLPVDRVTHADGSTGWTRSPGGLVSAIEPVLRGYDGVWMGWPGGTEQDLEPFEDDGLALVPLSMTAEDIEGHYEGFSNATLWPLYHDLVAKPEFHREWWEQLRRGQRALRRSGRGAGRRERHGLGPRLPAAAGAADAARAATRPADRLLPAHPVPAGRAVPAAAVAPPDPRGPARRRPGRLPAARRRPELRPPGPAAGRAQDPPRPGLPPGRSDRPGRGVPDLHRRRRLRGAWPRARRPWPARRRSAPRSATRAGCSSASTGSTTPRASTPGCARSAS